MSGETASYTTAVYNALTIIASTVSGLASAVASVAVIIASVIASRTMYTVSYRSMRMLLHGFNTYVPGIGRLAPLLAGMLATALLYPHAVAPRATHVSADKYASIHGTPTAESIPVTVADKLADVYATSIAEVTEVQLEPVIRLAPDTGTLYYSLAPALPLSGPDMLYTLLTRDTVLQPVPDATLSSLDISQPDIALPFTVDATLSSLDAPLLAIALTLEYELS